MKPSFFKTTVPCMVDHYHDPDGLFLGHVVGDQLPTGKAFPPAVEVDELPAGLVPNEPMSLPASAVIMALTIGFADGPADAMGYLLRHARQHGLWTPELQREVDRRNGREEVAG